MHVPFMTAEMGRGVVILVFTIVHSLALPGECCKGRAVLTDSSGIISDGDDAYPSYTRCEWLIDAQVPNKTILLEFDELNTECSYDFLFIYDGNSYQDRMLASLSGNNIPDPIMAQSGQMLVYLFSDRNYERKGFKARYSIQDCPMNCSGRGNCIDHQCYCFPGRYGQWCQFVECPNDCSGHGNCVRDNQSESSYCECDKGFSGYMCNMSLNDSEGSEHWYEISPNDVGLEPRSAHAGALLPETNCLYIFGGFSLNVIMNDLKKFCLESNKWQDIEEIGEWPESRYEHAIVQFGHGFYMFGGILENGTYSNELWYFNATEEQWTLCAQNSSVKPLQLSGHTLTLVENDLYLYGGKTNDGQFWANIYKINGHNPDQWAEVIPLGGKPSLRRFVGHSTVYHKESKSLLIYGGYSHNPDQPRFGSHTNNLHVFHVENRIWSQIRFTVSEQSKVPSQRSFHSAVIMGNYMVIYGGNTHIHHHLELCYDFEMYLYHLGCHTWVGITHQLGKYAEASKTMQRQGRVSHVAAAANGNILLVAGGYSGYVRGDLIAFKFPPIVAPPLSELHLDLDYCVNYTRSEKCIHNPDCLYCNSLSTTNTMGCLHRSRKELCRDGDTQYPVVACPGICGRLSTCLECLSQGQGASLDDTSLDIRTYIQPCNWCVKEAKCQQRSQPEGNCVSASNTITGIIGWWGGTSASLSQIDQCRLEDFPAGLHAIKYRPIRDNRHPDEVMLIRETEEIENFRHIYVRKNYYNFIGWVGFIHPLNATIKIIKDSVIYGLRLKAQDIEVRMLLSKDDNATNKELVQTLSDMKMPGKSEKKKFNYRPDGTLLFPNRSRGNRYYIEITGKHKYPNFSEKMTLGSQMYSLKLKWNGLGMSKPEIKNYHPFHYEFLEPYNNGNCSIHSNCLSCMTDTLCGWCEPARICVLRNTSIDQCVGENKTKIMVSESSMCPTCADHVECSSCAGDSRCEWVKDYVYCVRRGRAEEEHVVRHDSECPLTCHERTTCSACLNISECAWCENLRTCLPISDYVSRHRHGQCTEWIDSEVANSNNPYTCRNCSSLKTCDLCLKTFSCGWCGNRVNPTKGICYEGDFDGPCGDSTCSALITTVYRNMSASEPADWSYSTCPDVEECRLGMATCHPNASCINTPTSYNCTCNRGFVGNGKEKCTKTCYYECVHGVCMEEVKEPGEFYCDCNLGWTGNDCGTDCQCNEHSECKNGTGKCDYCINGTTGKFCNECLTGYYGDPSKPDGCTICNCNKHGNESKGLCHNMTGDCFCIDNTEGFECQSCEKGYYGDPRDGGECYLSCDNGLIIENITAGSVGSYSGPGVSTWRAYCLWIFTVSSSLNDPWSLPPTITLGMEDMAVQCERDHVYVYDGIPEFIDSTGSGVLLGAFCGFYTGEFHKVVARSGIVTVYFDADISGEYSNTQGFNGSYYVNKCLEECNEARHQYCNHSSCICMEGYTGFPNCSKICPKGCVYQQVKDSCSCVTNYAAITMYPWDANAILTDIHGNGPSSRYGHALIYCDDDNLILFGGRSLERGLLNDIWNYSFTSNVWTEIKPETGEKPSPRYFHAGECVPIMKHIYIFGGLVESPYDQREHVANKEMWKFNTGRKKWTGPLEPDWVQPIAGHTMTRGEGSKLIIIGGISTSDYFNDIVYIYDANRYPPPWNIQSFENRTGAKPAGIYGHSAVYQKQYKSIYIFGGHVFKDERLQLSEYLFTYDVTDATWNVLQPEPSVEMLNNRWSLVEPRYFHTAVGFDDFMAVIGGLTSHRNTSSYILIYKYKCNYWTRIDFSDNPAGLALTSLIAARSVKYQDSVFIHGGFSGQDRDVLYQIKFPSDICSIHKSKETCVQPGCSAAIENEPNSSRGSVTVCYTSGTRVVTGHTITTYEGAICDGKWHRERTCQDIKNCSECVAVYPPFKHEDPSCFWCENCMIDMCIPKGFRITSVNNMTSYEAKQRSSCLISSCVASTCAKCKDLGCLWSQNFYRESSGNGVNIRHVSITKKYDWSCVHSGLAKALEYYMFTRAGICPIPCYLHRTCEECLNSNGGEGGSKECYWSESLKECMPPAYLSLHCVGGTCGTVLQGTKDKCPAPCSNFTKCADCRRAQGCGWCANRGQNGKGLCMPGSRSGPKEKEMCEQKSLAFPEKITDVDIMTWSYPRCPPEDECLNGHHNCDLQTQNCNDELDGFSCTCKKGYINRTEENEKLVCTPVCHQGCVNGNCVRPEVCVCYFGYIGKNCSTKCDCNGHSNCESVLRKDRCLQCMNNTQGEHCEKCNPLFVGDPRNGGKCVSCTDFCHSHSDICVSKSDYLNKRQEIASLLQKYPDTKSAMFLNRFSLLQPYGPSQKNDTYCMDCTDNTMEKRCERCVQGYFRLQDMLANKPCTKCMCNGHSDICDSDSGLNCRCQNNTDTECNNNDNKEVKCHKAQCASCKEYFLGTPTDGHHCYRQMTVNRDYCFDPVTQSECTRIPRPLHLGRTVFFVVQPKYVNVDIRVTVDVTVGGIDVYFSPHDDTFQVHVDETNWEHRVLLDPNSISRVMRRKRSEQDAYHFQLDPMSGIHNVVLNHQINNRLRYQRSSNNKVINAGYPVKEVKAKSINTFITVNDPDTVLMIRNLQGRLVITLPNDKLNLKTSRFYMVFLSTGDMIKNETFGNLYFRQDQPHIDLFVFFSVFFSCFFLFLAMCVLLWKTKQGFDARRTRQQRAREMLHMASRPFAKVLVLIGHSQTPINISPNLNSRNRTRKLTDRTPLLPSETSIPTSPVVVRDSLNIVPIAIEPTDDGVAAIGTVVFQLPGGVNAPSKLCLGSTLTNQLSSGTTAGKLRRPPTSSNC